MRGVLDKAKLLRFMEALGNRVRGEGTIYLAGGATAVLFGWRAATIDADIKPDPEPAGLYEAIAELKEALDLNVELASPDQFIPAVPGWRERSVFIARHGKVSFFHYDPYTQALAKLQRGHDRDLRDLRSFVDRGLVKLAELRQMFSLIDPELIRYPAIDPATFRTAVIRFCDEVQGRA